MPRTADWYDQRAQHIIPHFPRSQELEIDELLALQLEAAAARFAANVAPNPQFLQQHDLEFLQQQALPPVRPSFGMPAARRTPLAAFAATSCL